MQKKNSIVIVMLMKYLKYDGVFCCCLLHFSTNNLNRENKPHCFDTLQLTAVKVCGVLWLGLCHTAASGCLLQQNNKKQTTDLLLFLCLMYFYDCYQVRRLLLKAGMAL